ncbi:MAG TPA: tetratricopeptide repeat protein, partial [Ignavibacteria bacterium]|nr:tetratricopeptide repeat protein [Ignavibacteria bacterium]
GKKTTINYIVDYYRNKDFVIVLEGYSDSFESPYSPIAKAFYKLIEESKTHKRYKEIVLDIATELLRLTPILGQYADIIIKFYKHFGSHSRQEVKELSDIYYQIQSIIFKLLKKGNVVLIFHNIESYDFSSLSLISFIANIRNFNFNLIITFDDNALVLRTHSEKIKLKELEYELIHKNNFTSLTLKSFSLRQTKEFLTSQLENRSSLSDAEIIIIQEKCGGNPFFIEELITHLKQEGLLILNNEYYVLKQGYNINTIPDSIKKLIELKLYRLQNELREIIDVAAVIGYEFTYKPIVEVLKQDSMIILRRLNDLKNIHKLIIELKQKHKFTYRAIQEIVYEMLGPNLAKEYHLFIAKYIEVNPIEYDNEYALYYHYYNAGEIRKSLIHLNNSALEAKKRLSFEDEANRYKKMVDMLFLLGEPAREEIQQIKLLMSEALYNSGQFRKVVTVLDDITKCFNRKIQAETLLQIAKAKYLCEDYINPKEILTKLLKDFSKDLGEQDLVTVRLLLSTILYHLGEWDLGRKHFRKCFRIPSVLSHKETLCMVRKRINMFYIPELALPQLVKSINILNGTKQNHLYWEIYHNIGCNYLFLDNISKAEKIFNECSQYFRESGNYRLTYSLNNLSIIELIRNNLSKSLEYIEEIKSVSALDFNQISASCHEALIYIMKKETKKGIEILYKLISKIQGSSEIILKELICHNLGWAYMQVGHYEEALNYLIMSIPKRKHPWLEFKLAQKHRLLQQLSLKGVKIPENLNYHNNLELLKRSGRKDTWSFLKLDYQFSEIWFWE